MRIYLDDVRAAPSGWMRLCSAAAVIEALARGGVTELSLDHDLGDDARYGTGYDVLVWLEQRRYEDPTFPLPHIQLHTSNPVGRRRMQVVLDRL